MHGNQEVPDPTRDTCLEYSEFRHNAPYAATDLFYVPMIPWDHVTVTVRRILAGRSPDIESDIVPGGSEIRIDHHFALIGKHQYCASLITG